jgi:hypothetical protein
MLQVGTEEEEEEEEEVFYMKETVYDCLFVLALNVDFDESFDNVWNKNEQRGGTGEVISMRAYTKVIKLPAEFSSDVTLLSI